MSSQCRQALPLRVQRLAQSGNIAMTEDRENAREQKIFAAVDFARLRCEEADERLGHREPDCGHFLSLKSSASPQSPLRMRRGRRHVPPWRSLRQRVSFSEAE